jgi:HSP20 family protein
LSLDNTRVGRAKIRDRDVDDFYREFDEIRSDMERAFSEPLKNLETKLPQALVKEYKTSDGRKVREIGPIVYGYSMNIGHDGIPRIREFGNVKSPKREFFSEPAISSEREPLIDVSSTGREIKIVAELP